MITFIDKWGRRRRGENTTCKVCGKAFVTRIDQRQTFCSEKCRHLGHRNRCQVYCAQCGNSLEVRKSRIAKNKSGLCFCNKECKDQAVRLGGIKEALPAFYGTGKKVYRRTFPKDKLICRRCGYREFPCSVDIHHIDENHSNNDPANLLPLCTCCHQGLHKKYWKIEEVLGDMVQRDDITVAR